MFNAGSVYYMDDKGRCSQCFTAEGPVKFLLYSEGRDMIVVVTEGLILSQHRVAHDGTTSEVAKVRAGNKFSHQSMIIPTFDELLSTLISYFLARVVQKVNNAIHQINHYPVDSVVCFVYMYPLDSDLSAG